jgi:hypothetical protein
MVSVSHLNGGTSLTLSSNTASSHSCVDIAFDKAISDADT